jgi:hypothetical protein
MNDFFTVNELAEYFGVNPKRIYQREQATRASFSHFIGRTRTRDLI